MPSAHLRRKALQMLLLSTAFWALSFPAIKALTMIQQQALPGASTWFITFLCVALRFIISGTILLMAFRREIPSVTRLEFEQGLKLAGLVTAGMCLQMDGLGYTSASTSAFLTQLYCVLIPVWLAISKRRFPTVKIMFCCALVLAGMVVLARVDLTSMRFGRGELETLASSVMFTAQILCLENPRYAANRPNCFTTVMLLGMGLLALPLALVTAPGLSACVRAYSSIPACALLFVLVLVCSIGPFLMMNRWQREVTATEAGLVYCAEPVLASALALFTPAWLSQWSGVDYSNEQLTARLLTGGVLITVANVLLQTRWLEKTPNSVQTAEVKPAK